MPKKLKKFERCRRGGTLGQMENSVRGSERFIVYEFPKYVISHFNVKSSQFLKKLGTPKNQAKKSKNCEKDDKAT